MLSFHAKRITLQQLVKFLGMFSKFLRGNQNARFTQMLGKYEEIMQGSGDTVSRDKIGRLIEELKARRIACDDFAGFRRAYFEAVASESKAAELAWLYECGADNEYDLCSQLYPLLSGSIKAELLAFMESSEKIQGIYEVKAEEFGQLKHTLGCNDEAARKLFNLMRFKMRSLSFRSLCGYLRFLLKMRKNVQQAMAAAPHGIDTAVSKDGIQKLLRIKLHDESEWLFGKVDALHGNKVSWKQIRKYMKKMVAVRGDMRDFFGDKQRDKHFADNTAEIMLKLADRVECNHALLTQISSKADEAEHDSHGVEEVRVWLSGIGMAQRYLKLFLDNGFDSLDMVAEIKDKNDLKYIGVKSKAHQMRLMNSIDALKQKDE